MVLKIKVKDGRQLYATSRGYKRIIECSDINTLSYIINNEFMEHSMKIHKDVRISLDTNNLIAASEFNKKLDKLEKYRLKLIKAVDKSFNTNKEISVTIRI